MGFKADPPDAIDSGKYDLFDPMETGTRLGQLAAGTAAVTIAVGAGIAYGRKGGNALQNAIGLENENADNGTTITVN